MNPSKTYRIHYSVTDPFPAHRVDLAELFGVELPRLGIEVEWFMDGPVAPVAGAHPYAQQAVALPPPAAGRWRKPAYWLADARATLRVLRRPDIDAIQCRDKYWGSLVAIVVARLSGKPFLYWCSYPFPEHDAEAARLQSGPRRALGLMKAGLRAWLLYRVILPRARHVFVQSQQMLRNMAAKGVDAARMTPVPMGVSTAVLAAARALPAQPVAGRIVYLGTLAAVRRLQVLLDALALLHTDFPEARLWFIGAGDVPQERADLEVAAARMGLADRVHFTGQLPMAQAQALLATASVCVSPISPSPVLTVGSPTKLVEYLAFGRPVVANDHPEQSEILQATQAGPCVPWSAEAFAQAIGALLADAPAAERAAAAGPAWVAAHRSYPGIARQVAQVYRRVLAQGAQA